jgi:hypothetical protein
MVSPRSPEMLLLSDSESDDADDYFTLNFPSPMGSSLVCGIGCPRQRLLFGLVLVWRLFC